MVEGCLDDHDLDRGGGLLDDMDEALSSEGGLLLEVGTGDLCDLHDPDLDESNRAIRYRNPDAGMFPTLKPSLHPKML